jgi:ABC-type molybdate transport system permease subunit
LQKGRRALLIVVLATALVMTPLVLGGVVLGFYVGGSVGYSQSVLAIAFSTVGFVAGMAIIFRVIKAVVARTDGSTG